MQIFFLLLTSMVCAAGMAIVFVEKRFEWPVRNLSILLRRFLQKHVHRKMHRMPKCAICLGFWTTFLSDALLFALSGGTYWLWPLSGFATAGAVWLLYTLLNHLAPITAGPEHPAVQSTPDYDAASLGKMMVEAHEEVGTLNDFHPQ